jgi:hypothetical protein
MLTRYNWLSTRVGDDAVPLAGLVKGVLLPKPESNRKTAEGVAALVPLRHRRFSELLGKQWEPLFFRGAPQPEEVEIFVDNNKFNERLKELNKTAAQNPPNEDGSKSAASA